MAGFFYQLQAAIAAALAEELTIGVLTAIVVGTMIALLKGVRRRVVGAFQAISRAITNALSAERILAEALNTLETGLWFRRPIQPPENYDLRIKANLPILLVANLKGGVGKTTICTNLAKYFASQCNEKVLLIDLDFQGSLSGAVAPQVRQGSEGAPSKATMFVTAAHEPAALFHMLEACKSIENARCITSGYDLATAETKLMVRWLLQQERPDIRYNLARFVLSDVVKNNFDRVIIDAPPRLTTAAIQAMCASTHLLIPTILDVTSAESVATYVEEVYKYKIGGVCPNLEIVGVMGSMTTRNIGEMLDGRESDDDARSRSPFSVAERQAMLVLKQQLRALGAKLGMAELAAPILPEDTFIQRTATIAQAAGGGPVAAPVALEMFERLGLEVRRRMMR